MGSLPQQFSCWIVGTRRYLVGGIACWLSWGRALLSIHLVLVSASIISR